jgi:hypothetical protein
MPSAHGIAAMSARETLAENLRNLMDAHHTYRTTTAIEKATEGRGVKVGKSTIDRALKCQTTLNLDYIDAIASIYGLDAWQLLAPGLAPKNPPVLRSVGEVEDKLYKRIGELAKEIATLQGGADV